jgi:alpha-glucosidase
MWNDIDLYHSFRDFTTDPVSFPEDEMRAFIGELVRRLYWKILVK